MTILFAVLTVITIGSLPSATTFTIKAAPKPSPTITLTATRESGTGEITLPSDGAVVFGVVSIVGTANSPNLQDYQLQWLASADPRAQWQLIAGPITQQISGGVLGQWDTSKVADGAYQIRLRLTLQDGTTRDTYVSHITVSNQQPTVLPATSSASVATLLPTVGPSPTALIQQPPTATVNPTFVALAANNADNSSGLGINGIDLSSIPIVGSLIGGAAIAGIGFILGAFYTSIRAQRRQRRKRRGFVR